MKVGDILAISLNLLGKTKLAEKLKAVTAGTETFTREENEEVKKLINCYNVTVSELSEEYLPLVYKEDLFSNDQRFLYSGFTKRPLEIKSVYRSVIPINFRVYPTYFTAPEFAVTVEYVYLPDSAESVTDDAEYSDSVISGRVLAEGVVSEYCIIAGMYEQALIWRDRYISSVENCLLKRKTKKLKVRGWY